LIQAAATHPNGRRVIFLGLEEGNVTRLREGKPIHLHADHLGFPGEIVIILGKDAAALQEQFKPFIGPETTMHDYRKLAKQ
jgi:formylmethanofuran dehydrogenase subunit A